MIPIAVEPDLSYARRDCGWGALDTARGRLPLAAVDIDARIVGLTSTTEVRQTFVNHLREPIEATYIFPLPDRAAVQRFRMVAGERVIEGELDERGRARATYDAAIASGHRAAIAEEDRAGVFTMRVGNLAPGEVVTVALTLSGPVVIDDGEVTWLFPLVVAPRYVPGAPLPGEQAGLGVVSDTDAVPDASRISPPVLLPGMPSPVRLGVRLTVDGGGLPMSGLRANLAEVDARAEGRGWAIALRPGQRLDRDLVLRWRLGSTELCSSAVWAPDASGPGATIAVTIVPPIGSAAGGRPRDVVLLLDRSGSMEGWKMVAARRAAARVIDSLTERDRFCVLAFDNSVEASPQPGGLLAPASDRLRFAAVEFLARVDARGGTELAQPLRQALAALQPDSRRDQVIVLITDGQVGNEDQILASLGRDLERVRMFTLGIDQAVNAAFLRRLAVLGGGACELVESEDRLDEVMAKIHRRIATPILTELAIAGVGVAAHDQAPRRLPAVFAGAPVTVYLRCPERPVPGQTIEIRGRLPAGTATAMTVAIDAAWPAVALEAAWGRAHIRDLEDRYAAGEGTSELERQIVAVSLRHRVLSRFTAFVAVDRSVMVAPGHHPRPVVQPVELPAGWSGNAAVPAAAPTPRMNAGYGGRAAPSAPMPAARGRMAAPTGGFAAVGSFAPPPPPQDDGPEVDASFEAEESTGAGIDRLAMREEAPAAPPSLRQRASDIGPGPAPQSRAPAVKSIVSREPRKDEGGSDRAKRAEAAPEAKLAAPAPAKPKGAPPTTADATAQRYWQRLRLIVDDLAAALTAAAPATAAQLPVARLVELVEDARSVGLDALVAALTPLVTRLQAALADAQVAARLAEVVTALRALSPTSTPTPTPPPARTGRSFWK